MATEVWVRYIGACAIARYATFVPDQLLHVVCLELVRKVETFIYSSDSTSEEFLGLLDTH